MTYNKNTTIRPSRETIGERSTTHGRTGTPEHAIWKAMIQRCTNPNNRSYSRYGGRGIAVCDRWRHSFENFFADMGERPDNSLTLERRDNELGYNPDNCTWDTRQVQSNNRSTCQTLTYNGRTQNITQWSKEVGIKTATLLQRLHSDWDTHTLLTTPVQNKSKNPNTEHILYQGQIRSLTEWAIHLNVKRLVLYKRLFVHHWSVDKAFTEPVKTQTSN